MMKEHAMRWICAVMLMVMLFIVMSIQGARAGVDAPAPEMEPQMERDEDMMEESCDPTVLYASLENETSALAAEAQATIGTRPGLEIRNVLWIGEGQFELICDGQYPEVSPFAPSTGPPIDRSPIVNWTRGNGTAATPGRYEFLTSDQVVEIPVLSASDSDELASFGVRVATTGGVVLNTPEESVLATYVYGATYLDDFVIPVNGPRLERHPNDHLATLISRVGDDAKSYFVVGKVDDNGILSLAAIDLEPGVTFHIRGNTVHTNDYVTGVVQEMYPEMFGIDEVQLKNVADQPVKLQPVPPAEPTELLYQILAGGATYEAGAGSFDGVLTLIDASNDIIVFTDRPERNATAVPTDIIVEALFAPVDGRNDDSFYAVPPNAAFSCMAASGDYARAIFVLQSPAVSSADIAFEVDVLFASGVVGADDDAVFACDGFAVRRNILFHVCVNYIDMLCYVCDAIDHSSA